MNGFRLFGDLFHVLALISLGTHFYKTRSSNGVSGCSLILFALVYTTRYLDLFLYFISFYNSIMKLFYICVSFLFIYLTYFRFNDGQVEKNNEISLYFLVVPCIILARLVNHDTSPIEILWTFSIYLEAVAIIPQMYLIYLKKKAESNIKMYLLFLFLYRGFYIFNWIFRYAKENHYDTIAIFGGVVDVSVFICFFVYYSISIGWKKEFKSQFAANLPQVITNEHLVKDDPEKKPCLAGNNEGEEQPEIHCISDGKFYSSPEIIDKIRY